MAVEQRTVLIEFPSVAHAVACHDGPAYQEALRALGKGSVDGDLRIVAGAEQGRQASDWTFAFD